MISTFLQTCLKQKIKLRNIPKLSEYVLTKFDIFKVYLELFVLFIEIHKLNYLSNK